MRLQQPWQHGATRNLSYTTALRHRIKRDETHFHLANVRASLTRMIRSFLRLDARSTQWRVNWITLAPSLRVLYTSIRALSGLGSAAAGLMLIRETEKPPSSISTKQRGSIRGDRTRAAWPVSVVLTLTLAVMRRPLCGSEQRCERIQARHGSIAVLLSRMLDLAIGWRPWIHWRRFVAILQI
jgi:hypothetical protein